MVYFGSLLSRWTNDATQSAGIFELLLLFSLTLSGALALTPAHHLSLSDVARLQDHLSRQFTDLESAYYSVVGLTKLGATVLDQDVRKGHTSYVRLWRAQCVDSVMLTPVFLQGVCQFIKDQLDPTSVDSLFFAAEISQAISSCEVRTPRARVCWGWVNARTNKPRTKREVIATWLITSWLSVLCQRGFFCFVFFTVNFQSSLISKRSKTTERMRHILFI